MNSTSTNNKRTVNKFTITSALRKPSLKSVDNSLRSNVDTMKERANKIIPKFEKFKYAKAIQKSTIKPSVEKQNPVLIELKEKLQQFKERNNSIENEIDQKKNKILEVNLILSNQKQEMKMKDAELSQLDVFLVQRERIIRNKIEKIEILRSKHAELVAQLNEIRNSNGDDERIKFFELDAEERFRTQINEINHLKSMLLSIRMQLEMTPMLIQLRLTNQEGVLQLNTENMSYEQMIALSEQIGSVSRGLSKEDIKKIPKYFYRKNVHEQKEGQDP